MKGLALTLALISTAAAAQCSDCEKAFTQCVKGCFANSKCRRACESERTSCCGPGGRGRPVDPKKLEVDCSGGDEKSCYALGALYFSGRGDLPQDYEKAAKFLEPACRDGQADACGLLGEMLLRPYGLPQDINRGLSLMEKSCDRGGLEGCTMLARVLNEGRHKVKDTERAMKLWREGCAKNHAPACTELGNAHLLTKREPSLALERFDRACSLGDGPGCAAMCALLLDESGIPRDEKRASVACANACADDQHGACANLGLLLWHSDAVKPDPKRGAEKIEAACEGGDAQACVDLAEAQETGSHQVKKNAEAAGIGFLRAGRRFEKQCNETLQVRPCALWGTLVIRGKLPNKDPIRTRAMLEKGCTFEGAIGCAGLGLALEELKEPAKAIEAYQRGCDAEKPDACAGLGRLLETDDPAKSRSSYEKGCTRWSAHSCARIAELMKADKAPPKEVKAMKAKACRYGAVEACK